MDEKPASDVRFEDKVAEFKEKFKSYAADGWTPDEVIAFAWDALNELIPYVQSFDGMSGAQKKQIVLAILREAYYSCDPDLPLVFGAMERCIESFILDTVASILVDKIVAMFNKLGWPA